MWLEFTDDVTTDGPQRDERLGWTGDIAAFAQAAALLYDVSGFLQDGLFDHAAERAAKDGIVPLVVPEILSPRRRVLPAMVSAALFEARDSRKSNNS